MATMKNNTDLERRGGNLILTGWGWKEYAVAAAVAYSISIDAVMNGLHRAKLSLIISDRYAQIGDAITQKISRGATVLKGIGWYTGVNKNVVMCVLKRSELFALQKVVKEIDPDAFMIITDAAEVLGSGFNHMDNT